jgi:isoquinoline 1-oxidoreductase
MNRRQFLASLGGTGLLYAFRFVPEASAQSGTFEPIPSEDEVPVCTAEYIDIDYRDWIAFGPDGNVTVFTGRTELGQGLKTVIVAIVTQGLEIAQEKLTVIQGDTDRCPDDGPTYGSAATRQVGWGFWLACQKIRSNLVKRAARWLGIPSGELEFRSGGIGRKREKGKLIDAHELGRGEAVLLNIDTTTASTGKQYVDLEIDNVNAEAIVTGTLKYVGDLHKPGMLYAGWLCQTYHPNGAKLLSADMDAARGLPGVKMVNVVRGRVAAFGERYSDVVKALDLVEATWRKPDRPKELRVEEEARAGAQLIFVKEEAGDVDAGLASSDLVLSETYTTQYIAHAPIETDVALAMPEDANGKVTVWVSSQWPTLARELIAETLRMPVSSVRTIAMPVGGAFGGKIGNPVTRQAALLASVSRAPTKLIYSRKDQFKLRSHFKAACIIDVTTGVNADGRMMARKVDVYQDEACGTRFTYDIPNVLVRAYEAKWPFGRAVSRGTSFVQTCFATESHVDMVAHKLDMDPVEFRRRNVVFPSFVNLIDTCAQMIGYDNPQLGVDEGLGMSVVHHGGCELGALAAIVAVDRVSGKIKVKHICAAFDIGTVINRRTATVGLRGGIAWGIGFALSEEVKLDGHSTNTEYLSEYRIPRFSDMPPIEITFLDNHKPDGTPRGCGELPVVPVSGAIANAVYNAVGVRLYSTPFTPERVKEALGTA